jgi:hypothetical protein
MVAHGCQASWPIYRYFNMLIGSAGTPRAILGWAWVDRSPYIESVYVYMR